MQILRLAGIHTALIAACTMAGATDQPSAQPRSRSLLSANAVHSMPPEQAAQRLPVQLRAVVTYYDPYIDTRHGALFVHDTTGGVFVSVPLRPILPLHAGDLVSIKGVTGPGDYASIVTSDEVHVIGASHLPAHPPRATLTEMQSGKTDGQWIAIEGRVRSANVVAKNVFLEVATDGGSFTATSVREDGVDYESLVDSLVFIHGNAAPQFNQRRQMVGVHVFFPSLRQVYVIEAAPGDPFSGPAVSVSQLFRFSPDSSLLHRVHVRGNVTLDWPGRTLCIEDAKDGICMQTAQTSAIPIGTLVDVVGFPVIRQFKPTLEDAVFRAAGEVPLALPPVVISNKQTLSGDLDGKLIQIDAELIGKDLAAENPTLMLRSGRILFPAVLPREDSAAAVRLKDGSMIRLTGICSVEVDSLSTNLGEGAIRTGSVQLLLENFSDAEVLRAPSWWTPRHALTAFASIGILVLASFAWIAVLRHRVTEQTQALRESEVRLRHLSEHDSLTGLPNRMLLTDRLQTALLRAERFGGSLGLLMVDADGFKQINDLYGHQAGDFLLCELSGRLTNSVRATDTVARIGGDEFVVLLPDLHLSAEAVAIAAKIVNAISRPVKIDRAEVAITVSVGVVTYPDGGKDLEALMQHADAAMYAAKEHGKNGLRLYDSGAREFVDSAGQAMPLSPREPLTAGNA
jgi:diguanylate cyclase (GGDEF)-like protein